MYVCLVVARLDGEENISIYQAPAWSNLEKGDKIILETTDYYQGTVIASMTCETESIEYKFILEATEICEPLVKVRSKLVYEQFKYDETGAETAEND